MKNYLCFLLVIFMLVITFSACTDNEKPIPEPLSNDSKSEFISSSEISNTNDSFEIDSIDSDKNEASSSNNEILESEVSYNYKSSQGGGPGGYDYYVMESHLLIYGELYDYIYDNYDNALELYENYVHGVLFVDRRNGNYEKLGPSIAVGKNYCLDLINHFKIPKDYVYEKLVYCENNHYTKEEMDAIYANDQRLLNKFFVDTWYCYYSELDGNIYGLPDIAKMTEEQIAIKKIPKKAILDLIENHPYGVYENEKCWASIKELDSLSDMVKNSALIK